jgi:hypothetical protein
MTSTRLAPHGGCYWSGCAICFPETGKKEPVYQGNGFVVETNDSGEIFVRLASWASPQLRLATTGRDNEIVLSYLNQPVKMTPTGYKTLSFETNQS